MKRFLQVLFLAGVVIAATGCVSTKNVTAQNGDLSRFSGRKLMVTKRPMPDFADFKPSNAMFGAIGGVMSVGSGNNLMRENKVSDPAIMIAAQLAAHCAEKFQLTTETPGPAHEVTGASVENIAALFAGQADLLLDVQTINWMCVYQPINWTRYHVQYSVKVRLIDIAKKQTVAEGFFAWRTPKDETFKYDDLFANQAAAFKGQLDLAAVAAVIHFKEQVLIEQ